MSFISNIQRGRKKLLWRLFQSYLLITFLSLFASGWFASRSLRNAYIEQTKNNLKVRAILISSHIPDPLSLSNVSEVNRLCNEMGERTGTRITVILPDGTVIGDSDENYALMDNHLSLIHI